MAQVSVTRLDIEVPDIHSVPGACRVSVSFKLRTPYEEDGVRQRWLGICHAVADKLSTGDLKALEGWIAEQPEQPSEGCVSHADELACLDAVLDEAIRRIRAAGGDLRLVNFITLSDERLTDEDRRAIRKMPEYRALVGGLSGAVEPPSEGGAS